VYGLGCNALDPSAITKIFQAKERPFTDPLITHVSKTEVAYDLWSADPSSLEGKALRTLCEKFWPGPLTLVAKAASHVPPMLMANTGFCACRSPQHPIAIALIDAAQVPLAAPSANKFGHVSPTRANHVWDDLLYEDVWIIETDQDATDVCNVGVESSVAKIEMLEPSQQQQQGRITLLRQGAVSVKDIQDCLEEAGLAEVFTVESRTKKATDETVATVAPGQTIRHYSPHIPSFILSKSRYDASALDSSSSENDKLYLSKSVLIDFGGKLKAWESHALAYRELSSSNDSAQATKLVFETLRWAETVDGASQILFPEISEDDPDQHDALALALKDRLTRAASGVIIDNFR
jgi:tRNA threonylcarbamoyl adenosine modification protein (Sua5/YciO/YrdC/YwlC family)